jgi:hypothetical protein
MISSANLRKDIEYIHNPIVHVFTHSSHRISKILSPWVYTQAKAINPTRPAMDTAPGATKPGAASGVGVDDEALELSVPEELEPDPDPELVESWLLELLELVPSVGVAAVETAVAVPVPVLVPLTVVAAAEL